MDKKYYYRMLGLAQEATPAQIKAAYEQRIAKLNAADYKDDPEYARKKMNEATMAYKVLMGSAPPMSKQQKRIRFEKLKDAMESNEGKQEIPKKRTYVTSEAIGNANRTTAKKPAAVIFIIAITIIFSIAGVIMGAATDLINQWKYDSSDYIDNDAQEIDEIQASVQNFDYFEMLGMSYAESYAQDVDWELGKDEYGEDETFDSMMELLYSLDIYSAYEFFDYVTGIEDYYYDYDDADCAETLIQWMNAPDFAAIAGSEDLYTGEPILSYADYLKYLERFIYEHR